MQRKARFDPQLPEDERHYRLSWSDGTLPHLDESSWMTPDLFLEDGMYDVSGKRMLALMPNAEVWDCYGGVVGESRVIAKYRPISDAAKLLAKETGNSAVLRALKFRRLSVVAEKAWADPTVSAGSARRTKA
jgi:hypothetical protein